MRLFTPFTLLVASSVSAYSASLSFDNGSGGSVATFLIETTGNTLLANGNNSGFIALYDFMGGVPADVAAVQANGSDNLLELIEFTSGNSFGGQFGGQFNFSDGVRSSLGIVVGDGTNVGDSSELALFVFIPSGGVPNPPNPQVFDNYEINGADITVGNVSGNTIQLQAVPEPSTALLGLIGLGFLARRKR